MCFMFLFVSHIIQIVVSSMNDKFIRVVRKFIVIIYIVINKEMYKQISGHILKKV